MSGMSHQKAAAAAVDEGHAAAADIIGTERSLGAIDAAMRAQGFRWNIFPATWTIATDILQGQNGPTAA